MKASNKELIDLVQIVLETYKIKEKGIKLLKENIKLNEFLENIVAETQPIGANSGIEITFTPQKNLTVFADPLQLQRVVKNLISNAISHSNTKAGIDIITGEIAGYATISVIDYGQGISQDEIKMIFNKYYSAAKKFRKIGTGLGLISFSADNAVSRRRNNSRKRRKRKNRILYKNPNIASGSFSSNFCLFFLLLFFGQTEKVNVCLQTMQVEAHCKQRGLKQINQRRHLFQRNNFREIIRLQGFNNNFNKRI